ncbi:hydrogenase formation protein HypD [Desulfovibrio inopinatus]|uniref:hydrogenase formation protein HypD n=1 Tax=Desulfovibrio inopinatus TaxID=102109 RepID=UPI000483E1F5|nr:hydrogenase formation protein HypD [Desulfovibrio inopinatus]
MDQTTQFSTAFQDPDLCRQLLRTLQSIQTSPLTFMEVCGTHTVAIFRSGLHSLLPDTIEHLSGPGCPVCVTHDSEVAAYLKLAERDNVIIATFGDLLRVPGPNGKTLKTAKAEGARVEIVYSPFDALTLAVDNPTETVVFLGIGFETTAPTVAATVKTAQARGISNLLVMSFHKLVPPALAALVADNKTSVDAFLLPGHVSTVIGLEPYRFLASEYGVPGVVTGFEPADILQALIYVARMRANGEADIVNAYTRAVASEGNPQAVAIMNEVFDHGPALWRGIGGIDGSGLIFSNDYAEFDALRALDLTIEETPPLKGCQCGDVLKGIIKPNQCRLFGTACTPAKPVGPCMVSTEGSCAAYYKYRLELS